MKKKLIIGLWLVTLLLVGCTNQQNINKSHQDVSTEANMEEVHKGNGYVTIEQLPRTHIRIETLRAANIEFPSIHEINDLASKELKSVTLKVDYYVKGQFSSTIMSSETMINDDEDSILLYALFDMISETEAKWLTTVQSVSETSSSSSSSHTIHAVSKTSLRQATYSDKVVAKLGEEVVLGYISMNESNESYLSSQLIDNINNNEHLYVISCIIK